MCLHRREHRQHQVWMNALSTFNPQLALSRRLYLGGGAGVDCEPDLVFATRRQQRFRREGLAVAAGLSLHRRFGPLRYNGAGLVHNRLRARREEASRGSRAGPKERCRDCQRRSDVEAKRAGHDSAAGVNPRKGPDGQKRDKMPPSAVSSTQSDDAAAFADHDDSLSSSLSSLPPTQGGYNSY